MREIGRRALILNQGWSARTAAEASRFRSAGGACGFGSRSGCMIDLGGGAVAESLAGSPTVVSEMNTGDLNTESQGSNSPENPRQNAPEVPDGFPTKGGGTGQNAVTQTKQQTAQMPMKSTTAAQTAQQSIAGGEGSTPAHSASFRDFMAFFASLVFRRYAG